MTPRTEGFLYLAAFGLCIPAANWLIGHAGTACVPHGPCLVPVAHTTREISQKLEKWFLETHGPAREMAR